MKKILLISPPASGLKDKLSYPPLGLLYLASNLNSEAHVDVLNMISSEEHIDYNYDLFGITLHSVSSFEPAKNITERIKRSSLKSTIIVGGSFPASMAEFTLKNSSADIVVHGEGERTFSNLCDLESFTPDHLKTIKGISFKWNGNIFVNPPEDLIDDLDSIHFPARHLLPAEMIKHEGRVHHSDKPATTIFATRGCAFKCSFCDTNMWRRKWRSRTPENIIMEIKELQRDYDIHWFRFPDDCITLNRSWFVDFCNKIKKCNVEWTVLSRSDTIDAMLLKLMKEAGCREIFFGFESGSQRILNIMKKKITVEQNIKAVEMCKDARIVSCAYMMFGFPGEDERSVEETKRFLLRARPDKSRISTFIPIPGTDVWNYPEKYGVTIKSNYSDYWYFDTPDFGIEYDYIGNEKMETLRQEIICFYEEQGYFKKWEESNE